jgi:hypothetical protein
MSNVAQARGDFDGLFASLQRHWRQGSLVAVLGAIEALAGWCAAAFFVTTVIGFFGLGVLANAWFYNRPRLETATLIAATIAWPLLLWLSFASLLFYLRAMIQAADPVPVNIALLLPRVHLLLRPLFAAWWLMLAAAVVVLAHYLTDTTSFYHPTFWEKLFMHGLPFIALLGASFATNTLLLIAIAAVARRERLLRGVWHFRILIDLAVTMALMGIHFWPVL